MGGDGGLGRVEERMVKGTGRGRKRGRSIRNEGNYNCLIR